MRVSIFLPERYWGGTDSILLDVSALSEIPSEQEIETEHKFYKQVSKDAKKAELADLISKYKK